MFDEVALGVVPNDEVSVPCAASCVIAKFINGLLAQRAGDFFFQQRDSKTISHSNAENPRFHNRIFSIVVARDSGDKTAGMGLGAASKTLRFADVGDTDQMGVHLLVELKRGFFLREHSLRHAWR